MATYISLLPVIFSFVTAVPQIFTDSYKFCDVKIAGKQVPVPDKLWTISNRDFQLFFSLCKTRQSSCGNQTSSCLVFPSKEQINFMSEFDPGEDDFTLVTRSTTKCRSNPAKNYSLVLLLQCSDSTKPKPRLMPFSDDDECTFEVEIMRPGCRPKCTELVNSYLLDFRTMKNTLRVTDPMNFSVSFCGSNPDCPGGIISACVIDNQMALATKESQHFNYDAAKNELTARGRYKEGRTVRDVQVLIKCRWETELANARYKRVQIQGKHYRFEVESSFGCIKLPHNCAINSIDNLHYNLTGLYKREGWEVTGAPNGDKILMNICGPLPQLSGDCAAQHSQVCHFNQNEYKNRGSILSSLQASDDVVKATFVSGSVCRENQTLSYSTQVIFKCSRSEKGPVFTEIKQCVMFLTWETPRACPIDVYVGQNCYMNDRVSNRDLKTLHTETDSIYPLDQQTKLLYNLCGAIHESCSGFTNVSFCLKTPQSDVVIGWETKELISETGNLRMVLHGSSCTNQRSRGEVIVHFVCSYESRPTQIRVVEDSCRFNVTIFTHLACLSHGHFKNCTYSTSNTTYDLSPLTKTSDNYVVSNGDVDFILNLCGNVVTGSDVLCKGDTMVCWRNSTEINIKHKFKSLGGAATPLLRDGRLVVEAMMGTYCPGAGHYKSVINFECAQERYPPTLLARNECVYNFEWKTPEACPQDRKCLIPSTKPDVFLDLTNLQKKSLVVNVDNRTSQYEFNLCTDGYTKTSKGVSDDSFLTRHFVKDFEDAYLVLDLGKSCNDSNTISKVIFKIECSLTTEQYQHTAFEKCLLNMTLTTPLVCSIYKEPANVPSFIDPKTVSEEPSTQRIEQKCRVINGQTGYEFSLSDIKSEEVVFNGSTFGINLNGSLTNKCVGVLCRNNTEMIGNVCPTTSFDYLHQRVSLQYSSSSHCSENSNFYKLEILLRCNDTKHETMILKDNICETVIAYDLPEACFLLKQDIVTAGNTRQNALIAGVVSSIVILSVLALLIYLNRRKCTQYMELLPFYKDKTAVPIYTRDSTL